MALFLKTKHRKEHYIYRVFDSNQSRVFERSIYRTQKKAITLPKEDTLLKANSFEVNINFSVLDM